MNTPIKPALLLFGILLALGAVVGAYTGPTVPPMGDNGEVVVVDESANNQLKKAGLSVGAFHARGDAAMLEQTFFLGRVRGGTVAGISGPSTVYIGSNVDPISNVTADVSGSVFVNETIQSDQLANGDRKPVCVNDSGTLVICQ